MVLDSVKAEEGKELEEFVVGIHRGPLEEAKGRLVANVAGIRQPKGSFVIVQGRISSFQK